MNQASQEKRKTDLLEELAKLEHDQWKSWALNLIDTEDLSRTRVERWKKTCFKSYNELTEEEKDQDRIWAEQVLWIVKKHMGIR